MAPPSASPLPRQSVDEIPFTRKEWELLREFSLTLMADSCCLGSWLDSLEHEVKNYISCESYVAFNGFVSSMIQNSRRIFEICKSKDLFLDLPSVL